MTDSGRPNGLRVLLNYGTAVFAIVIAALIRHWLDVLLAPRPFVPFFLAILIVIVIAGPGPGAVATIGSALAVAFFFLEPAGSLEIAVRDDQIRWVIFVSLGLTMSLVAERIRQKRQAKTQAEADRLRDAAMKELQRTEERYRKLFETSRDGIALVDLGGQFLDANDAFQCMVGYSLDELQTMSYQELTPFRWRQMEAAIVEDRILGGGDSGEYEKEYICKDGSVIPISIRAWPERGPCGELLGMRAFVRDITDRKRAEEVMKESARRKDQFIATMAHELRNPLAAIRSATYVLWNEAVSGKVAKLESGALPVINRQLNQLVRLVDDLLDVSRIKNGKFEIKKRRIDLTEILRHSAETVRSTIDCGAHDFEMEVPEEPLLLDGDAVRLEQIFTNLLNNAASYTNPGGRIWLTAVRRHGKAIITVRDTGVGIPEGMLLRIFEPFSQADNRLKDSHEGLGIGLTLVKALVELHGGAVEAQSEGIGLGSAFVVSLPVFDHDHDTCAVGALHELPNLAF
ncbi:MAG: PAS domain-containing sensor histidine kinase [Methylocystis sp.]|uniref:PAS domain-containing sensor histidine kinase n=1 Tax=Methylocystis sp. TaxID=1911079 RepID=UPI003DA2FA3D